MGHWVCLWITTKVVSLVDDGEKLVRRYRVAIGVPLLAGQRCSRKLTWARHTDSILLLLLPVDAVNIFWLRIPRNFPIFNPGSIIDCWSYPFWAGVASNLFHIFNGYYNDVVFIVQSFPSFRGRSLDKLLSTTTTYIRRDGCFVQKTIQYWCRLVVGSMCDEVGHIVSCVYFYWLCCWRADSLPALPPSSGRIKRNRLPSPGLTVCLSV